MGWSEEDVSRILEDADGGEIEIWPENWETVALFCGLETQWRVVAGVGGALYQGLDYTAVRSALEVMEVKNLPAMFCALQVMERAALPELNRDVT